MKDTVLGTLMVRRAGSVDPSKFLDEEFDLYSIPAYDRGRPEVLTGAEIGSSKQIVEPGDVLLSRIVPHIRRAWIVGPSRGRRIIASGEWIVFRSDVTDARWLRHYLLADAFHVQFMQTVAGVGGSLLRARPAQVSTISLAIPPLDKQRRIAAVLDLVDTLRAKRRAVNKQLEALEKANFIATFGDPVKNNMGWPAGLLGDWSVRITDGEHKTPLRTESGIPLLSARSIQRGWIDFGATDFVAEDEYEKLRRRIEPQDGDVLISCSGTIGRVARVRGAQRFAMVRSVALVRPAAELSPGFLEQLLATDSMNALMNVRANSSAQANLFQNQIQNLPVIVPPIALQKSFELQIEAMTRQRALSAVGVAALDGMFASLQYRAFSGRL